MGLEDLLPNPYGDDDPASPTTNSTPGPMCTEGSPDPDDSEGAQAPAAETNTNLPAPVTWTLPLSSTTTAIARNNAMTNAVGSKDPEPVVQPQPTVWKGHVGAWTAYFMREKGKRNNPGGLSTQDSWSSNGCHALCLAMILNWWQCLNPDTLGTLAFPFPNDPSAPPSNPDDPPPPEVKAPNTPPYGPVPNEGDGVNPPFMCRRLFNMSYVPTIRGATDWEVDHHRLQKSVLDGTDSAGNPTGVTCTYKGRKIQMQTATYNSDAALGDAIKYFLQFGPLIILLSKPGHFVVVAGFRGNIMYICDSGDVIINPKYWGHSPSIKKLSCGMVAVDVSQANFQYNMGTDPNPLADGSSPTKKNGDPYPAPLTGIQFLSPQYISMIEVYEFPYDKVPNLDWSDPAKSPTPT